MAAFAVPKKNLRDLSVKKIVIVGAGGFGRELLYTVRALQLKMDWEFKGFLDDNPQALDSYPYTEKILGGIRDYRPQKDEFLVMGIATPTSRKLEIAEGLLERGAKFISLIHPATEIGANVKIGRGCIISPNVAMSCDIEIGDFVTINGFTGIGHDARIGSGCSLHAFVNVNGFAQLGRGVEVGSHGCILPGAKVGDFAKIGAGSVVLKNVKPGTTVFGVPAKRI